MTKTWHDVRPATYGNRDVDWRRFCSRGLLGTSTTPCVPFSVLELAINKQGQLLPRSGWLRKTTPREDRYIVTCSRRNRLWTCRMIATSLMNASRTRFSVSTFLNRLWSAGLKEHGTYVGIPLTVHQRRPRLIWARGHYRWSRRKWNQVLFTDESRFNVQFADGRLQVWRRTGEIMDEKKSR